MGNNPIRFKDPSGHAQACADGDLGGGCGSAGVYIPKPTFTPTPGPVWKGVPTATPTITPTVTASPTNTTAPVLKPAATTPGPVYGQGPTITPTTPPVDLPLDDIIEVTNTGLDLVDYFGLIRVPPPVGPLLDAWAQQEADKNYYFTLPQRVGRDAIAVGQGYGISLTSLAVGTGTGLGLTAIIPEGGPVSFVAGFAVGYASTSTIMSRYVESRLNPLLYDLFGLNP